MQTEATRTLLSQVAQFRQKHTDISENKLAKLAKIANSNFSNWKRGLCNASPSMVEDVRRAMRSYDNEHPMPEVLTSSENDVLARILGGKDLAPSTVKMAEKVVQKRRQVNRPAARWNKRKEAFMQEIREEMVRRGWGRMRMSVALGINDATLNQWLGAKGMQRLSILKPVVARLSNLRGRAISNPLLPEPMMDKKKKKGGRYVRPMQNLPTPSVTVTRSNDLTKLQKVQILAVLCAADKPSFDLMFDYWFPGHAD